jgi:hypothetical protein
MSHSFFVRCRRTHFFNNIFILGSAGTLEFALIYDETNNLLLVNILRAKVTVNHLNWFYVISYSIDNSILQFYGINFKILAAN